MTTAALSVLTVSAGSYSIWYRRYTFASETERSLTWAIALMLCGYYLVSPISTPVVGAALHRVTGIWHLDTSVGTVCHIAALATVVNFMLTHFFTRDQRIDWLSRWVYPPVALGVAVLAACIISTRATYPAPSILDIEPDGWLLTHRLVAAAVLAWLWLVILRTLLVMRADPGSRRLAGAGAWLCGVGVLSAGVTGVGHVAAITVLHAAVVFGFMGWAVLAWRDKLNQFAALRRAVRCHGRCPDCRGR